MTAEELEAQISILKAQLDSLSRQLSDLETKKKFKNFLNSVKNMIVWTFPLVAFLVFVALLYFLLQMSWEEFIQLLKVLIWPVTILIILFCFRKIFTYLCFSMEEFNLFGTKGKLRNIQDIINEKANELRNHEKITEEQEKELKIYKERDKKNQAAISSLTREKDVSVKQWSELAREISDKYNDLMLAYKKLHIMYTEKIKEEKEARERKEAIQKYIEERRREKRDLPL